MPEVLKGKLRHIKNFKSLSEQKNPFKLVSAKPKVTGNTPPTRAWGETYIERRQKLSKNIIDCL